MNVLVTGVSGANTGTQILSALQMCPNDYSILATDVDEVSLGHLVAQKFRTVPPASDPDYVHTLIDLANEWGAKVVAPGSEPELFACAAARMLFAEAGIHLLINNTSVIELCADKAATMRRLQSEGFLVPAWEIVDLYSDVQKEAERLLNILNLPLVLKPYVGSGGSKMVNLVQSSRELELRLELLQLNGVENIMAQEYEGSADKEYTIGVLSDLNGDAFSSFALRRLINSSLTRKELVPNRDRNRIKAPHLVLSTGVSQGWVDDFPEAREFAESVANALGSQGPLNIQCRQTDKGFMTFEINPRFSGTSSIRAMCGHNDLDMIIRQHVLKQNVGQAKYKCGLIIRSLQNTFSQDAQL